MNTSTLLDTIAALKGIEALAAGKTTQKLTPQQRLDLCEFAARTQAQDLAYYLKDQAAEVAQAAAECATLTQPQRARKRTTKRK